MSGFKRMLDADVKKVFINDAEFANCYTVVYDGETFEDIPLIMSGIKEQERKQIVREHGDRVQGLYLVTAVIHVALSDLNGVIPEKGMKIQINDGDFFREYRVASSVNELGMIRAELEAIDE